MTTEVLSGVISHLILDLSGRNGIMLSLCLLPKLLLAHSLGFEDDDRDMLCEDGSKFELL